MNPSAKSVAKNKAPVIVARHLVKKFGKLRALGGLDLTVMPGEVHGFLGPNGAGKSTTIRVLLGMLRKNGGDIWLFGEDPWKNNVDLHKRLAYVPGDVNLWPNLSGGEAIDLIVSLRGGKIDKERRAELIDKFKLDPTKKCGTYSKGNRQKVAIVAALSSEVDLYILDEPTAGLDPLMQDVFNREIVELKKAGKTVLLSSHVLAEVEQLCDRVTIIKDGKTVESGALSDLRRLTGISIDVKTKKPLTGLKGLPGVHSLTGSNNHATMKVDSDKLDTVIRHLTNFTITSLNSMPPTLDELFMRYYGEDQAAGKGEK